MELYFRWPNKRSLSQFALWTVLFLNLGATVYFWIIGSKYYLANPDGGNIYIAAGRLAGLIGQIGLLTQLVLISRFPWVERPYGFDRLNRFHRWMGYILIFLLFSHPVLLIIGGVQQYSQSWWWQLADYLANKPYVLLSFFGLLLFIFVVILSISIVRRKMRYETWYFVHLLTYVALMLAFLHQLNTGDLRDKVALWYWLCLNFVVFTVVVLWRWLRPLIVWLYHDFHVDQVVQETPDVWSFYLSGRRLGSFRFQAGQYANLRFLTKKLWWQSHPFSFSVGPDSGHIRFSIKGSGDFTRELHQIHPGSAVLVDGPLGQFVTSRARKEKLLLIAGGIGITPLRSIIEEWAKKGASAVLLYAARTPADLALRQEIETIARTAKVQIHYVVSAATPGYETGFIDREKIVRLIPDFYDREVFLCGPPPMMKAVVRELRLLGLRDEAVHFEKFSF